MKLVRASGALSALLATVTLAGAHSTLPADVSGQEVQARAVVEADTTQITVGDPVIYTVTVEHAPGAVVGWPDSLDVRPFEVLAAETPTTRVVEGRARSVLRLTLTAFELGTLTIPSLELSVAAPDASTQTVTTDAFGISVVSVGLDEGGEIREIKGPLAIPRSVGSLLPWLLLIAMLGLGAWWLRRRARPDGREFRPVEIPRSPHLVALDALDRVAESGLLERGEVKEYHVQISEIIRIYVEGRYHIYALEMTSGELLAALGRVGVEGSVKGSFQSFLDRCDMVKFAKLRPSPEASRETLELARSLVEGTRPRFEPVDAAVNATVDAAVEASAGAQGAGPPEEVEKKGDVEAPPVTAGPP